MSHHLIKNSSVVKQQLRTDIPAFSSGSVVEVFYKIVEGNKERIQSFKGLCVAKKHGSTTLDGTFTILKVASGSIKVKRTFPIHSPLIDKVVVHAYNRARRAKLYVLETVKDPIKSVRTKAVKIKAPKAVKAEVVTEAKTVTE